MRWGLAAWFLFAAGAGAAEDAFVNFDIYDLSFDDVVVGGLPAGWRSSSWAVRAEPAAPSPPRVLACPGARDGESESLLWTPGVKFLDGTLEVKARCDGLQDQALGIAWRVRDAGNFYLLRYSPAERNLRVYVVKNGAWKLLADAARLGVGAGELFALKIEQRGEAIEGYLNGRRVVGAVSDAFREAGGIGVWCSAGTEGFFDDLKTRIDISGMMGEP